MTRRLALLVSGSSGLLDGILAAGIPVALVVADRPCDALDKAQRLGITAALLEAGANPDVDHYSSLLADVLMGRKIGVIVAAGFETPLAQPIVEAFDGHIIEELHSLLVDRLRSELGVPAPQSDAPYCMQ